MENKQKILDNLEKISRQAYADMSDTSNEYDDVINKYMKKLIVDYGFSRDTAIQLTEDFVHQTSGDIKEALEFSLPGIGQGDNNEKVLAEFYKTGNLMKSYKSIGKNIQDIEFQDKVLIKKYEEKEKNKTEEKRKDIEKRIKELGTSDNEEEVSNSDNSEEIKKLEKELKTLKTGDKQNNSNSQKTQELDRIAAGLLAFFLGGIGVHKFYMGKSGQGILYLLFFWTFIPAIIAFIESILYFTCPNNQEFMKKYVNNQ